ncbi:hypothetical protein Q4E93_05885 [Flavitalea sp. BT771]|uniref:hypothetical protein n=1 Tax=Flavitalea sp. BT771 TaxID=3063329 RepID=UPI0026E120FC|nr:hypothetical protein [Flavitalea sp. BT771]MDO6430104.1 hypothetical protein [Flavitalea sp. BT771]MDV6219757.1 hypothetical protein [Flavitalea sp. BT771]
MKFIITTLLIALLSFVCGLYLPWWGFALAAFLVSALIPQRPGISFLAGFLGLFLLWTLLSWAMDAPNNSILSKKIAVLLPLGGSTVLLILITALVGALVGGGAALTGSYIHRRRSA